MQRVEGDILAESKEVGKLGSVANFFGFLMTITFLL